MDLLQRARGVKTNLEDNFLNETVIVNKDPGGSWRSAKMSGVIIPDPIRCDVTDPKQWSIVCKVIEPPTGEEIKFDLMKTLPTRSVLRIFQSNFENP